MTGVIKVKDSYYILATAAQVDERTRVLKFGETFGVFDRHGDINAFRVSEQGIFHDGTRFLSRSVLWIGRERPLLLGSTVTEDNALLAVDLTNPDMGEDEVVFVPRGTLHIFRSMYLADGACFQRLRITNHGLEPVALEMVLEVDADFADIFEVRGTHRERHGTLRGPDVADGTSRMVYDGLDGRRRISAINSGGDDCEVEPGRIRFRMKIAPHDQHTCSVVLRCLYSEEESPQPPRYDEVWAARRRSVERPPVERSAVETSNEQFNSWLRRSVADLGMMTTMTPQGPFPYAGVPWFSTVFGRDGLLTAYESLWHQPDLARGVLRYLASTQADEDEPDRDAEPGKILHESRSGEMAALGEVPFARYYGSADATPLFVMLAARYYEHTGDLALVEELWPNIERALGWVDGDGDRDGDGFVEYAARTATGLVQQGWKDSQDSVFHASGELARGPIALVEIQAYVYGAKVGAAALSEALGDSGRAQALRLEAAKLKEAFQPAFWDSELGMYVLALDGDKKPCAVRSSNAGHVLLSGLADAASAAAVAEALTSPDMFSGWGVRTIGTREARYNPVAYHNGSVWPHDSALVADGLARYGHKEAVLRILDGLFDASLWVDLNRLPELFCGFERRPGEGPTSYPLACAPQAWASAAVFLLLRACMGLKVDGVNHRVQFDYPVLPNCIDELRIHGLRVGNEAMDLAIHRFPDDVAINVLRRTGDIEVVTIK